MSFKKILTSIIYLSLFVVTLFGYNNALAGKYDQISLDGSEFTSDVAKDSIAGSGGLNTTNSVPQIVGNVIKVILGISGTVALIFIVWGGIQWMISKGEESKIASARKLMVSGMVGIAIIAAAYAITDFVIKQITVVAGA